MIKSHLHVLSQNVFGAIRHCTSPTAPCNVATEMGRKKGDFTAMEKSKL